MTDPGMDADVVIDVAKLVDAFGKTYERIAASRRDVLLSYAVRQLFEQSKLQIALRGRLSMRVMDTYEKSIERRRSGLIKQSMNKATSEAFDEVRRLVDRFAEADQQALEGFARLALRLLNAGDAGDGLPERFEQGLRAGLRRLIQITVRDPEP